MPSKKSPFKRLPKPGTPVTVKFHKYYGEEFKALFPLQGTTLITKPRIKGNVIVASHHGANWEVRLKDCFPPKQPHSKMSPLRAYNTWLETPSGKQVLRGVTSPIQKNQIKEAFLSGFQSAKTKTS